MMKILIASALLSLFATQSALAADENQALRDIIKQQQQVLTELERRLDATEDRLEKTADVVDAATSNKSATTVGGYGELHYNNITNKKTIDFHRFVLFFGHEFTENIHFFSELELEHSLSGNGEDKPGEVELEQAYIEYYFNETLTGQAGLFLIPVGIINETHEPNTFYGVERNPVEKHIIPTTWWEAGAALKIHTTPGLTFDTAITSGLNVDQKGNNAFTIRSGRQKVAKAKANDLAYTVRVKYTAITGLELAATAQYQADILQGTGTDPAAATLLSAHIIYSIGDFTIKGLYAQWNISGTQFGSIGANKQNGFYIEPDYRFNESFGIFARYNQYDNTAGQYAPTNTKINQTNVGFNYWIHESIVFKADYVNIGGFKNSDGFNLGMGYVF